MKLKKKLVAVSSHTRAAAAVHLNVKLMKSARRGAQAASCKQILKWTIVMMVCEDDNAVLSTFLISFPYLFFLRNVFR